MTAHMYNWSNPAFDTSPFFKFEAEGDTIEGVITDITETVFPATDTKPEQTCPVLHLDTAQGVRELTIGAVDLLAKTKAKNPQVGDWYSAAWVATAGKKRIFMVIVKKIPDTPVTRDIYQGAPAARAQADAAAARAQQSEAPF